MSQDEIVTEGNGFNRRRFLIGTGAVAGLAVAAACGGDDSTEGSGASTTASGGNTSTTAGEANPSADLAVAQVAAGLEVLAVGTYQAALDAAAAGKLGDVPPAVAEFATTALGHHQEHLKAWNGVITGAGEAEVTEPPAELKATVDEQFATVKDAGGAAKLALMLEEIAAATYTKVVPTLSTPEARKLGGSIQIIDRQHISVLLFALGQYPVPEVFASTEQSAA